jgi:hypothetical protein
MTPILRSTYGAAAEPTDRLDQTSALLARNSGNEATRGFSGGFAGTMANINEFLGSTLSQYGVDPTNSYNTAAKYRAEAANLAPAVQDYRYVTDRESLSQYVGNRVGQGVGSTLPALAGAALSRNPYLGAYAVSVPAEGGETLYSLRTDPQYKDVSEAERYRLGLGRGVVSGALEAVVPGAASTARSFGRSLGTKSLQEGATENLQTRIGQMTLDTANPNRDTSGDIVERTESFFSGVAGGAGIGLPGAIADQATKSLESGASVFETMTDKAKGLASKADFDSIFTRTGDRSSPLNLNDSEIAGDTLEETEQNILESETKKSQVTRELARELGLTGDSTDPDFQSRVAAENAGSNLGKRARLIYEDLKRTAKEIKPKLAAGTKKSEIFEGQADAEKLIFSYLTEEAAKSQDVLDRIGPITSSIVSIVRDSENLSGKELRRVISTLKDTAELFNDPVGMLNELGTYIGTKQNLFDQAAKFSSAESDAANENSFLRQNIKRVSDVPVAQLKEIGRFIDEYATLELDAKSNAAVITRLSNELFGGSEKITRNVLNYYAKQNGDKLEFSVDEAAEEGLRDAPDPGKTFMYREPAKKRPYRAFSRGDYKNIIKESRSIRGRSAGTASVKFRTLADVYGKLTPEAQTEKARELYKDVAERYKEEISKRGPDTENAAELRLELSNLRNLAEAKESLQVGKRTFEPGPKGILQSYGVFELEERDQNDLKATDDDLAKMRTLVENTTRDTQKELSKTYITFERKGKPPIRLSAESMWKTMWEKEGKSFGGSPRKHFYNAVAAVMAREDITGMRVPGFKNVEELNRLPPDTREKKINEFLSKLIVDRATGRTGARSEKSLKAGAALTRDEDLRNLEDRVETAIEEYLDADSDRQQEIYENITTLRDRYQRRLDAVDVGEVPPMKLRRAVEILNEGLDEIESERFAAEVDERGYLTDTSMFQETRTQKKGVADKLPTKPNKPVVSKKEDSIDKMAEVQKERERVSPSGEIEPKETVEDILKDVLAETRKKSVYAEGPASGPLMTEAEKQQIKDYILKVRGKKVKVIFDRVLGDAGAAGSYHADRAGERIITIASKSFGHGMHAAYHEAMHDFFKMLMGSPQHRRISADLLEAASAAPVTAQLRELLKNHTGALEQIEKDPEERLAYMYQFWAAGELTLGTQTKNWFTKIAEFFREVLGVMSKDKKIEQILQTLHEGGLSDPSTVAEVLYERGIVDLGDKMQAHAGPVIGAAQKVFSSATDRLRQTNIPALSNLADMFQQEPGREGSGIGFLQKRAQQSGKFVNKFQKIIKDSTVTERKIALHNLQSMKEPSTELEKAIRDFLEDMHKYMVEAGVKDVFNDNKDVGYVKKYFPRIWDYSKIEADKQTFVKLLHEEGQMSNEAVADFLQKVRRDPDREPLSEGVEAISPNAAAYTPYAPSVRGRVFDFITESNAEKFAPFQQDDLVEVISAYIFQTVHRGEFARYFGNAGETINAALLEARNNGASADEITGAVNAIAALEGTLGNKLDPKKRDVMMGVMTYENIVLLPFAIFSSLVDPLGIALRTGDMKEAWNALKEGANGIRLAINGQKDKDEGYQLAMMLGIIDEHNMLESMGKVYTSVYMSRNLKKINTAFFKYNGMQMWTERMRIAGMYAAMRFIAKNTDNARYMTELGLEKSDVKILEDKDGVIKLALEEKDGLTKEEAERIQTAIFKFVDSAVLRPNAAHRPVWGSDPRFMLLFHLKQFTFSFQKVILTRVKEELKQGSNMPFFILASYVPFMLAADLLKGSLTGTTKVGWHAGDYLLSAVDRSGVLGIANFGVDAVQDVARGRVPGSSFLGPTAEHIFTGAKTILGAPGTDAGSLLIRSLPAAPVVRAVVN